MKSTWGPWKTLKFEEEKEQAAKQLDENFAHIQVVEEQKKKT